MAKVKCYNCKKTTPVVAPQYRCKFCNYPLNKYLQQEEEPDQLIIDKPALQDEEPKKDLTIHDIYRQDLPKVEVKQPKPKPAPPKVEKKKSEPVLVKNPEKDGKVVAGWLIIHTEEREPITYELFEGDNIIGRPDGPHQVDIRVKDDEYVSRVHAMVRVTKDFLHRFHYQLLDNGKLRGGHPSTNGTYINGLQERLQKHQAVFLRDGDTVQVGTTKMVFKNTDESNDHSSAAYSVLETDFTHTVAIRR